MSELKAMFGDGEITTTASKENKKPKDKIDSKFDEVKKELKKLTESAISHKMLIRLILLLRSVLISRMLMR